MAAFQLCRSLIAHPGQPKGGCSCLAPARAAGCLWLSFPVGLLLFASRRCLPAMAFISLCLPGQRGGETTAVLDQETHGGGFSPAKRAAEMAPPPSPYLWAAGAESQAGGGGDGH